MKKRKISKSKLLRLFSFIVIYILLSSILLAQENPTKKVLILNSYSKGFVQTDNIVKGSRFYGKYKQSPKEIISM